MIQALLKEDCIIRHVGVWIKTNPVPMIRMQKFMNGTEQFVIATKNKGLGHHFNKDLPQSPDWFKHHICCGGERLSTNGQKPLHPNQKPIALAEWLIRYWSFRGDNVLDPFAGTGTFGHACLKLGRNCTMFESDPRYCEATRKRLYLDNRPRISNWW